MFYRRNWSAVMVVILGLAMFVPVAQAQRQDFETVACVANTSTVVQFSQGEIYVGGFEGKGIVRSTHENKVNDNNTLHQIGVAKWEGGKYSWNGFYKSMRPDGEFIIWEFSGDSISGSTAKAIYGSGKLKGVKGEAKSIAITKGKPIVQGTEQICTKTIGWIELPK